MKWFNPMIKGLMLIALLTFTVFSGYAQMNEESLNNKIRTSEVTSKPQNTSKKKQHHKKTKKQKPGHAKKKGRHASSGKGKVKIQADIPFGQPGQVQDNRKIR